MSKCKVGILGLGTVGIGVYKTLQKFTDLVQIEKIAVKDITKKRKIENLPEGILTQDAYEIIKNPDIQVVIEVIGGITPIFDYVKAALENGKHVVTANKELIAKKYEELADISKKAKKLVLYEASTCAGIPLINPIKTILQANSISGIHGVVNKTSNIILSKISKEKLDYSEALKITQELGFAEANPRNDVEGFDSLYKLINLCVISFKKSIKNFDQIYREGITKISAKNMENAEKLGYLIKLLAIGNYDETSKKYDIRVHPTLIKKTNQLSCCEATMNGVIFEGLPMGEVFIGGKATQKTTAGFHTASAVVGDVLCLAKELKSVTDKSACILPMMEMEKYEEIELMGIEETFNKYYIEMNVQDNDKFVQMEKLLGNYGIGIEQFLKEGNIVYIITTVVQEKIFNSFIEELKKIQIGIQSFIRVEV